MMPDNLPRSPGPDPGGNDLVLSAREASAAALHDLWRCLPDLAIYDILFKVIGFVLLTPMLAWVFRQFVATSGNSAVGNFDIARFLLTPFGVVASLALGSLFFAVTYMESAGLMYIGRGALIDRRRTYFDALCFVRRRIVRIIKVGLLTLVVFSVAILPLAGLVLLVMHVLLSEHDINYYLEAQPPEYVIALVLGAFIAVGAVLVLALLYVGLMFLLPNALFREDPVRAAVGDSLRLVRRNFRPIAVALVGCAVALWVVTALVNAGIYGLGHLLVDLAGEHTGLLLAVLGVFAGMHAVANAVLAFAGLALISLLTVRFHRQLSSPEIAQLPDLGADGPVLDAKPVWSIHRRTPLVVAALVLAIGAWTVYELVENVPLEDRVDITAHRGSSMAAPENTLSAVRRAIDDGATFVEFDVQLTADGVLVVAHDADLMRTARVPLVISKSTHADLKKVDLGIRFDPKFAGERIPTLEEVIDATKGKIKLIVELKSYQADAKRLAADVVRMLEAHNLLGDAVVMSLEYSETQEVKRLNPRVTTGFVSTAALGDIARLNVDFLAVNAAKATNALIGTAHAQGKMVYVWTVNEPHQMSTMIDRGVDNIITDDPATLVGVLRSRRDLGNAERILMRFKSLYSE
jgi:glycerophosphoryl diester phosphodiesterase